MQRVITRRPPARPEAIGARDASALRQRCLVHRLRNLHSKAPDSHWPEIAIRARACYEA